MSEKYNIPEPNSLDSVEGPEDGKDIEINNKLEISPEVERLVMKKVKDIFAYGTAYAGWGGGKFLNTLEPKGGGYFFKTALRDSDGRTIPSEPDKDHGKYISRDFGSEYFNSQLQETKRVYDKKNPAEVEVEISPSTIREYLLHNHLNQRIEDVFKFGYQSDPNLSAYDSRSKYYNPEDVVKSSDEYRKSVRAKDEFSRNTHNSSAPYSANSRVYFYVTGKQGHVGARYTDKPKDHIVDNHFFRGISLIFDKPSKEVVPMHRSYNKDDKSDSRDGYPGFGEFTFSHGWFSKLNPFWGVKEGLSLDDPQLIEYLEKRFDEIKQEWPEEVGDASDWREYSTQRGMITAEGGLIDKQGSGFVLRNRIAPRKFKGLVIDLPPKDDRWGIKQSVYISDLLSSNESIDDVDDTELHKRFLGFMKKHTLNTEDRIQIFRREIIRDMVEACKDHPENIVPIYDGSGNLIWPKEMSYEEIAKMKEK